MKICYFYWVTVARMPKYAAVGILVGKNTPRDSQMHSETNIIISPIDAVQQCIQCIVSPGTLW